VFVLYIKPTGAVLPDGIITDNREHLLDLLNTMLHAAYTQEDWDPTKWETV
jgi:hypothetical protein